jgi:hypothetical protein
LDEESSHTTEKQKIDEKSKENNQNAIEHTTMHFNGDQESLREIN